MSSTELFPDQQPNEVLSEPTPVALLQIAVNKGATVDQLTKLMELNERWEANQARKAYNEAMAEFKQDPPEIFKNKHVKFGNTEYDHATLDHIVDELTPALSRHGIGLRWEVNQTGNEITVACVLTHAQGHSERTTLKAAPDTSGSKNGIQAIGSAVTYLQRYSLLAAVGMAAKGQDDDGAAAGMTNGEVAEQVEWIKNAKDLKELQKLFSNAYKDAQAKGNKAAMAAYVKAKDERKAELQ